MIEVLVQNDPYRYVKMPDPLENGQPDYRIQKWNNHNGYKDMYLCDNFMQFKTAIDDFEYTKCKVIISNKLFKLQKNKILRISNSN